jgi:hypothetical protein
MRRGYQNRNLTKNKIHLIVRGEGKVSLSLVKEAKRLKEEDGEYDEV